MPMGDAMPPARAEDKAALASDLVAALIAPAVAFVAAELIYSLLGVTRLGILFLAFVTLAATIRESRAAVFAALLSVVAYRLFLDLRTND